MITCASTDIALQSLSYFQFGYISVPLNQFDGTHDHAGCAESALQPVIHEMLFGKFAGMAAGGLLMEIAFCPMPRAIATKPRQQDRLVSVDWIARLPMC